MRNQEPRMAFSRFRQGLETYLSAVVFLILFSVLEVYSVESFSGYFESTTKAVSSPGIDKGGSGTDVSTAMKQYEVKKHDRLWKIAGREEIYSNPDFWEYIYEANRDILGKKFRRGEFIVVVIEPGMVLKIPPVRVKGYLEGIKP